MKKIEQEELDQILAAHKLWVESGGKRGKRANLAYADLQDACLQGANLAYADLQEARLFRADLTGANLEGADLFRADLFKADLQGVIVPPSIRHCLSFGYAKFSRDALPWLILHPWWAEWKDTVQIIDN